MCWASMFSCLWVMFEYLVDAFIVVISIYLNTASDPATSLYMYIACKIQALVICFTCLVWTNSLPTRHDSANGLVMKIHVCFSKQWQLGILVILIRLYIQGYHTCQDCVYSSLNGMSCVSNSCMYDVLVSLVSHLEGPPCLSRCVNY
jgi:hypothetical protein